MLFKEVLVGRDLDDKFISAEVTGKEVNLNTCVPPESVVVDQCEDGYTSSEWYSDYGVHVIKTLHPEIKGDLNDLQSNPYHT